MNGARVELHPKHHVSCWRPVFLVIALQLKNKRARLQEKKSNKKKLTYCWESFSGKFDENDVWTFPIELLPKCPLSREGRVRWWCIYWCCCLLEHCCHRQTQSFENQFKSTSWHQFTNFGHKLDPTDGESCRTRFLMCRRVASLGRSSGRVGILWGDRYKEGWCQTHLTLHS